MGLSTWWLFVGMTFVISATPGPNMLLVMRTSARCGWRSALATMAGCMTSLITMLTVSAAGLGAVLHAAPQVFEVLRLLGALYLAYLGVMCWRSPVAPDQEAAAIAAQARSDQPWSLYRQGALVAASNPKALLFAAAFFPQFMTAGAPQVPQFAILLSTFSVIEISWYVVYALSGQGLSRYLQRVSVRRIFNRVTGGAFVGFALLMAGLRE